MEKKIIIAIVFIVLLVGGGAWYFFHRSHLPEIVAPTSVAPTQQTESVAGAGWSTSTDETQAVQEAVNMMLGKMKKIPDFAFVFCASKYNEEKVLAELQRLLPQTKILGGNSGYGVTTPGGYFWYPLFSQSISILGIATDRIIWGVGIAPSEGLDSKATAKQALLSAIENAGKDVKEKPALVINMPTFDMTQEETLEAVGDLLGPDVPVFGAYAADQGIKGDWRIFTNERIYSHGVVMAVVYTDLKIGFYKEHGFEVTETGGTITKADGKKLIEINNRPAAEVYNELIGGLLTEEVKNPTTTSSSYLTKVRVTSALNPLARVIKKPGQEPFYAPAMVVYILPDRSLQLDIAVQEGDELKILRGDWEILLNRMQTTAQKAMETFAIQKEKILFALDSFCCATNFAIPQSERPKEAQLLKQAIGGEFVGICACGIQCFDPQRKTNTYSSLSNGILIFSEP